MSISHYGAESSYNFLSYVNVPRTIASLLSAKVATLHELDTVYGMEDVFDMLEVLIIDSENARIARSK